MSIILKQLKLLLAIVLSATATFLWLKQDAIRQFLAISNLEVDLELPKQRPTYSTSGPNGLYLDLLKLSLVDFLYEKNPRVRAVRFVGGDFPGRALTMIGLPRLDNLQKLAEEVIQENIPGDFIEAGAWRGGATIFMRGILKAHQVQDRKVWVADSFEGLPPPNAKVYPDDFDSELHLHKELAVSIEEVRSNFDRYGLLDDQVQFLKGWFKDTLPKAPIEKLAILRIDADMYESTMDALKNLYPKLSKGGYVIIDDAGAILACNNSVRDFRRDNKITAPVHTIDWTGIYWRKSED